MISQTTACIRPLIAAIVGMWIGLIRRMENARTPAPVWNDPSLLASEGADDRQRSAPLRGHGIGQPKGA